jgi:hypothetical protein
MTTIATALQVAEAIWTAIAAAIKAGQPTIDLTAQTALLQQTEGDMAQWNHDEANAEASAKLVAAASAKTVGNGTAQTFPDVATPTSSATAPNDGLPVPPVSDPGPL